MIQPIGVHVLPPYWRSVETPIQMLHRKALEGDRDSIFCLAEYYKEGICVPKDEVKARQFYEEAAALGHTNAMVMLSHFLRVGIGGEKNIKLAFYYSEFAADIDSNPRALHNLFCFYDEGLFVQEDPKLAVFYCEKAAEQGHIPSITSLGAAYELGRGVSQDEKKARELYEIAACPQQYHIEGEGDFEAMFRLHHLYREGRGGEKELWKANHFLLAAANRDHPEALCDVGILYLQGKDDFVKDERKAISYLERSRELRCVRAIYNLAYCYDNGIGVSKNTTIVGELIQEVLILDPNHAEARAYWMERGG